MICTSCDYENREDARFCTKCGVPLVLICNICHTPAQEEDIYCATCGARLLQEHGETMPQQNKPEVSCSKPASTEQNPQESSNSQRKNVTVLFADLSGFTAMSEKLDPEEVTTIMNQCLDIMGNAVTTYEGYIDKFIGDCIMAIFGAPVSHENDPELAIRAALKMRHQIEEFNKKLPIKLEKPLALHIGINTGLVIAGQMGSNARMDYTVMGDTVNLASRLESNAVTGQIFISAYTYGQVKNLFEFVKHDPIKVKGKIEPVDVYEVVRELDDTEIKESSKVHIPLVGRTREIETITSSINNLKEGMGQALFLVSEPGFGKSRAQEEMKTLLTKAENIDFFEVRCHSFGRNVPYHLFTELFKRLCTIECNDMPETMIEKLTTTLPLLLKEDKDFLCDEAREALVLIGKLLDLDLQDRYNIPISEMLPEEISSATIRAIKWVFTTMSRHQKIALSIEDMHYIDTASSEIIAALISAAANSPIMLILLLRPEKNTPSSKLEPLARRHLGDRAVNITFERLIRNECESLAKYLLDSKTLPKELSELVSSKADGNPLFLQEIIHSLLDSGAIKKEDDEIIISKELLNTSVPSSITGIIMSRYDQLPSRLRELLCMAAVIGTSFKRRLLSQIVGEKDLDKNINKLIEAQMIFESQSFPDIEYSFQTTYIQEAVYETLLLKRRQALHLEVAKNIQELYEQRLQDHIESLAHHYLEAGDKQNAYNFLVKSGMKAKEAFANETAATFLKQALDISDEIKDAKPSVVDMHKAYSEVLELLGDMDGAIRSWEKVIELYDDTLNIADAMRNIGRIEEKRGVKEKAIKVYEEAIELVKDFPESIEYGLLLMNLSWVLNRFKKSSEALKNANQALGIFNKENAVEHIALCCNNIAVFYENLDELDEALKYNLKSLKLFKEIKNRRQIGNVELSLGYLRTKRNEHEEALGNFTRSAETMDRIGNKVGSATALLAKGRCYSDMKRFDEAELVILQALRNYQDLNMDMRSVAATISLINVLINKNELEEAVNYINRAKAIAGKDNFSSDLGKLIRLDAKVLRINGKDKEADAKYQEAYKIFTDLGRAKDAKSVEKEWKS